VIDLGSASSPVEGTQTIRQVLAWITELFSARGLDGPRLQAEILLAHATATDRIHLYMDLQRPLDATALARIRELVRRRAAGEPTQHLVGKAHFYGRAFGCDRRALIPRPETEVLVETCLRELPADKELQILDLCCGSGVVGLSLLMERPLYLGDLADLSGDACALATENAVRLHLADRARVHRGDLFAPFPPARRWDVVVANPPYLESASISRLEAEVRDHDPHLALDGGSDGLDLIRRLAREVGVHLQEDGLLALEIGDDQGPRAVRVLVDAGWAEVRVFPDLAGRDRVAIARKK
jgi:release factor glutamine methyltransferase